MVGSWWSPLGIVTPLSRIPRLPGHKCLRTHREVWHLFRVTPSFWGLSHSHLTSHETFLLQFSGILFRSILVKQVEETGLRNKYSNPQFGQTISLLGTLVIP